MNAPIETQQAAEYLELPIDALNPSPTNPRKRFNQDKMQELANSIKAQGILQPLLVRHIPGKQQYEVIAGERRYRAAKLAGLDKAPCFIRELTDLQVLHAQVIENLQRDDLHPIEEAEGYEKLMQQTDEAGNQYTADTIAAEVGKSRAYVYGRLKLLALCTEARDAFFSDDLDASTALLIARIPVSKLQLQALKAVTEKTPWATSNVRPGDKVMSYRTARDYIQREFMLDLSRAPFLPDDALLVPKAGACTTCEKRTGNQPDLFDDVGNKDVCTDTVCFGLKKMAHVLAIQQAAENEGHIVIKGKEAKKLISKTGWPVDQQLAEHGMATLDSRVPGDKDHRTFGEILQEAKLLEPTQETGKPALQKTLVQRPGSDQLIETVNLETAMKALREAGFDVTPKATARANENTAKRDKEAEKLKIENTYRGRLFDAVHQHIEQAMEDPQSPIFPLLYRKLAENFFEDICDYKGGNYIELITRKYIPASEGDEVDTIKKLQEAIPTFNTQQHFMLLCDILLVDDAIAAWSGAPAPTNTEEVATAAGIDIEVLKAEAEAEFKAAKKEAGKASKKAKAKEEA